MTGVALAACQQSGAERTGTPSGTGSATGRAATAGNEGAAAPGSSPTPDARRPTPGIPRVVFLGTSLTAGLGLDPDSAYPALVARLAARAGTPITAINAGVSGETSAGALRRVEWVLREPAELVVIETGANDGLRGQSPDSLRANLEAIVARARAVQPRARLALVQMEAPRNLGAPYAARFRAVYPEVAERTGVPLLPFLLDRVAGVPRLNQPDGVHPNEEGERLVAANVWRALAPLVAAGSGVAGAPGAARATVQAAAAP